MDDNEKELESTWNEAVLALLTYTQLLFETDMHTTINLSQNRCCSLCKLL